MLLIFFPKLDVKFSCVYQNVSYFTFTCQTEADYKISGPS